MSELAEFLLARIAEDEALAESAASFRPWTDAFQKDNHGCLTVQPARVLRECEAKRRIVEFGQDDFALYQQIVRDVDPLDTEDYTSGAQWMRGATLRALASVYADHPDYREEWKP